MAGERAALTAAAIEDAALDLALELGYDSVTVDMICERVGVSQRTFFNRFPTKDDAILGRTKPKLDERAARRFILGSGPILSDAFDLVQIPQDGTAPRRVPERMRIVATSPQLLTRQRKRMSAIEGEITEVIALRLEHERPEASEPERHREASLITHLLMGAIHWATMQLEGDTFIDPGDDDRETRHITAALAQAREMLPRVFTAPER